MITIWSEYRHALQRDQLNNDRQRVLGLTQLIPRMGYLSHRHHRPRSIGLEHRPAAARRRRFSGERHMKRLQLSGDRGSMTLEMVIVAPAMLLILAVVVFAGRVVIAGQSVDHAAAEAARTASLARTAPAAQAAADTAARDSLAQQGLRCSSTSVSVDTAGFSVPAGTPATISATITCIVDTADLAAPGIPGSRTVTGRASSPLDTYRERS